MENSCRIHVSRLRLQMSAAILATTCSVTLLVWELTFTSAYGGSWADEVEDAYGKDASPKNNE